MGDRLASLIEVVICSGFVTQTALGLGLLLLGVNARTRDGGLSLMAVTLLSLSDTALLLALMFLFLRMRGDSPKALFLDNRSVRRESLLGLATVPVVLLAVGALGMGIERLAPWLHTVEQNPLASLLGTGRNVAIFGVVVVIAGGVREELQRAFVLDRFERHLGGAPLGLFVYSIAFGLGHTLQGWDAAVLVAALGAVWGVMYLWRRSVVAPIVCHALFNLAQVLYHGVG
jgi:membrane protease YdiL (CAAX protease family)